MIIYRRICEIVQQNTQILLHFLHSFRIVQMIGRSDLILKKCQEVDALPLFTTVHFFNSLLILLNMIFLWLNILQCNDFLSDLQ